MMRCLLALLMIVFTLSHGFAGGQGTSAHFEAISETHLQIERATADPAIGLEEADGAMACCDHSGADQADTSNCTALCAFLPATPTLTLAAVSFNHPEALVPHLTDQSQNTHFRPPNT